MSMSKYFSKLGRQNNNIKLMFLKKVSPLKKKSGLNTGIAPICSTPPPPILGSCGALLRVNRDILQNATKQRKTSLCWLLKMY